MYFNLYIYTNSYSLYCNNIISLLKDKFSYFEIKKVIYRTKNSTLIKQLSLICDNQDDLHFLHNIPNYDEFSKMSIIIDDNIDIWKYDKDNVISVKPFEEINIDEKIPDDTLLILTNRLFFLHYKFFYIDINENNIRNISDINDIKKLISKYKLYN